MITFKKVTDNITQIHSEFEIVLGDNTDIMKSMQAFLHSKHDTITSINTCTNISDTNKYDNNGTIPNAIYGPYNGDTITGNISNKNVVPLHSLDPVNHTDIDIVDLKVSDSVNTREDNSTFSTVTRSDVGIGQLWYDALYRSNIIKLNFRDYKEYVEWALWVCTNNIPTPFNLGYPSTCYQLVLNHDSFVIRFPNNIGISIKVFSNNDSTISYEISLIFYTIPGTKEVFIRETDEYQNAIKWNWVLKE